MSRYLSFLLLVLYLTTPLSVLASSQADLTSIDEFVIDRLEQNRVPGAAWAVLEDGHVVHIGTHGVGITEDTPMLYGSVSKSYTATLIMMLVDRGDLALSDTLEGVLPWFSSDDARASSVTVEQLLNHTSGYSRADGLLLSEEEFDDETGIRSGAERVQSFSLAHEPGAQHEYSDVNYVLLAAAIEEVTGQPYEEVLHESLLEPLGMVHTGSTYSDAERIGIPQGYQYVFTSPRESDSSLNPAGAPYGFIYGSIHDLSRWAEFHAIGDEDILSRDLLDQMHAGSVSLSGETSYGFGWRDSAATEDHPRRVWHGGANKDFGAFIGFEPDTGNGVVFLQNIYSPLKDADLTSIPFGVLDMLGGTSPQASGSGLLYPAALAVGAIPVLGSVASAAWTARHQRRLRWPFTIAHVIVCAVLIAAFLLVVPPLLGGTLGMAKVWTPDLFWLIVASTAAMAASTGLRLWFQMRRRARPE